MCRWSQGCMCVYRTAARSVEDTSRARSPNLHHSMGPPSKLVSYHIECVSIADACGTSCCGEGHGTTYVAAMPPARAPLIWYL
jgi:hypothetical protein